MKRNLKIKIENVLLELNKKIAITPTILDYPRDNIKGRANKENVNKIIKRAKFLIKELKSYKKTEYNEFTINQLEPLINFLENREEMRFEEMLRMIFGVDKIRNIDCIIHNWEEKLSKGLKHLGINYNEWQKLLIINLNKKQAKYFYHSLIENLKKLTLKKFGIEDNTFRTITILEKPIGVYWYFFVNKPTLIVDNSPQNFYLIKRKISHETFPGHHFIESIRRKYYGKILPRYKAVYSPLAAFEEGLSEYLYEVVFPICSDVLSEIAHTIVLLKYAYCYKVVEKIFEKNKLLSRISFYKFKYLSEFDIEKLVRFVEYNKIYVAVYTPSYLLIKRICEKEFYSDPVKIRDFLLLKPMDMFILRDKYLENNTN